MPDTTMEAALAALATVLAGAVSAEVIRNATRPEDVPAAGLVVLRDGAQQESEATFSPLRYHIDHGAEVVVHAQDEATRSTLLAALAAALIADRTLGGAVEYLDIGVAGLDDADFEGSAGIPGALMPVTLSYTTLGSPLG